MTGHNAEVRDGLAKVCFDLEMSVGAACRLEYAVNGKGEFQVRMDYRPLKDGLQLIPKVGMRMRIPAEYSQVSWYGRGPQENYPDRKSGYFIGQYSMPLDEFIFDYASPQDNANRCDTRWFSLGNGSRDIEIHGLQELNFRAWPYGEEDLEGSAHPFDIPARDFINVNIDFKIHGVGGNDGWGARTMDAYTIDPAQPYSFGFIIR